MPDPLWPSSPPEVNYLRLVGSGAAGTASTLASAAAWVAVIADNEMAAAASAANTAATAVNFEGAAGAGSAAAATGMNTALHLLAAWAGEKPPIAGAAVSAYETAVSTMIPGAVSVANRTAHASNVAVNPLVLGALTPAIAALDIEYFGEHWPHNAGAGAGYGAALAALAAALVVPPPMSTPGASPAAPAMAGAAVAEASGGAFGAGTFGGAFGAAAPGGAFGAVAPGGAAHQIGQLASTMIQPLSGMFETPMQAAQGLLSLPQSLIGQVGGLSQAMKPAPAMALPEGAGPVVSMARESAVIGAGPGVPGGIGTSASPALTSFTRPTGGFAPEPGGRPVGLKPGLLTAAELRGPTTSGGGVALPMSPAPTGMLGRTRAEDAGDDVGLARIVLADQRGDSESIP